MKAIILKNTGPVDNLILTDLPIPSIADHEILIQIKAISINPVDVKTRDGKGVYGRIKGDDPIILGWDVAGIITKKGAAVRKFEIGDQVFGMVNFPGHGKAYAEYVAAPANQVTLKPKNITFEEAAASTLVALTAWQALVGHGKVKEGQHVLIHAASGGVGHMALQMAKYLGAKVTGTSSLKNKDFVVGLGADEFINYQGYDWDAHLPEFDFVLDTIGGDNIDKSIAVTNRGGTIISIPTGLSEEVTEKAKLKGISGYNILVQSDGSDMAVIAHLLEDGFIKPHISHVFAFKKMAEAHLQMESGRTVGKIVLTF